MKLNRVNTIDEYIADVSDEDVKALLEKVRSTVQKAAPKATEAIKYNMPTFLYKGRHLVYFAANKKHLGFYPAPAMCAFRDELRPYQSGRGTLKFFYDEKIPFTLITKVVKHWVNVHDETK
jgi:uncharacterized protein YdhG (YjbR/CyaY superfamily)